MVVAQEVRTGLDIKLDEVWNMKVKEEGKPCENLPWSKVTYASS